MNRKFRHWAYLNHEGTKKYGMIYPNGEVPVISMVPGYQKLEGIEGPQKCFMIHLEELTKLQFEKIILMFHEQSGISKKIIEKEIRKHGLPLRAEFTSGSGTNQPGLFF